MAVWSIAALFLGLSSTTPARAQGLDPASSDDQGLEPNTRESADREAYWKWVDSAVQLRRAGDLKQAQSSLAAAHALYPNARTFRGLGVLAADLGDHDEAVRQLEAALASTERPLQGALRDVTVELLERVRSRRSEQQLAPSMVPELSAKTEPSPGPLTNAVEQRRALPAPIETQRSKGRVWRNPWLWGAVGVVVVGSAVVAGTLSRRSPEHDRGTSGMLVGSRP